MYLWAASAATDRSTVRIRRYTFVEHQLNTRADIDHKADTRQTVQLGGIVVHTGHVDGVALLGLLAKQTDRLNDPVQQQHLRLLGRECHQQTTREKFQSAHDGLAV